MSAWDEPPPGDDERRWGPVVLVLLVLLALTLALAPRCHAQDGAALTCPGPRDPDTLALSAALRARLRLPGVPGGRRWYVAHCRAAPGGCEARVGRFAGYIVEAGRLERLDPWLLAALAVHESALSPAAESRPPFRARGILQLHPRSRASVGVRFVRGSRAYRRACLLQPGACQLPVVLAGARYLREVTDWCGGDAILGLGAYGTGRCEPIAAAAAVLRERARLRLIQSPGHNTSSASSPA